jgi:toxin secretion/phage lysis holin
MSKTWEHILQVLASFGVMFFGNDVNVLKFVYSLGIFMTFDIITGIAKAIYLKSFKAGVLENGIIKKVTILVAVSFCYFIDKFNILNAGVNFETIACMFFIVGELVSNMENFSCMGLKLPTQLIALINKKAGEIIGK